MVTPNEVKTDLRTVGTPKVKAREPQEMSLLHPVEERDLDSH